jgi:hypothetical protein
MGNGRHMPQITQISGAPESITGAGSVIVYLSGGERINLHLEVQTDAGSFMSLSFVSVCPKCKDVRRQEGFGSRTLFRLLRHKQPIEAYCVVCDEFWPISISERAALVRALAS